MRGPTRPTIKQAETGSGANAEALLSEELCRLLEFVAETVVGQAVRSADLDRGVPTVAEAQ